MTPILYLLNKNIETNSYYILGSLSKKGNVYMFKYSESFKDSGNLLRCGRMLDTSKEYFSNVLFPLFTNRILNKKRSEYRGHLKELGLPPEASDEEILIRTGGIKVTDTFVIFPNLDLLDSFYFRIFISKIPNLPTEKEELFLEYDKKLDTYFLYSKATKELIGKLPLYFNVFIPSILRTSSIKFFIDTVSITAYQQVSCLIKMIRE